MKLTSQSIRKICRGVVRPVRTSITGILICSLLFPGVVSADSGTVAEIVMTGNQSRETAAILPLLTSKVGAPYAASAVNEDVKTIYKLGLFQDVRVETVRTDKGVSLLFVVVEKPVVSEIRVSGNREITRDKIITAMDLKTKGVFSTGALGKSIRQVKRLYTDEGYYLAEVTGKTEKVGSNSVRVLLSIIEGNKVLIRKIRFEGNKAFSARKIRKQMQTKEKSFLSWMTGAGTYKEDVLATDVNRIGDLYFNNGYINVKVGEPKVSLLPDRSGLEVVIGITEGEQFRTGDIDFKGELLESGEALMDKVKVEKGKVFSREVLRRDVQTLTDLYGDKGYAFANINPLTRVDPEQKRVHLTFDMETGEKVFIERINISGNTKTRDKVIRREFKLAEGDQYSVSALKRTKQNLANLGFFEEASIAPATGSAGNKLILNTEVKEKSTGQFSIGGGFSSADGIIGQASVQQTNFLGLGLKGTLSASLGGKTQLYNIGITDPYFLDSNWTLGFDVYRSEREYEDYSRRVTGFNLKGGYRFSDKLSTFWLYKYEDKKLYDLSAGLEANPSLLTSTSGTISSLYASVSLDTTDYRLDPSRGYTGMVSAEYAGLGGTQRFTRFIGQSSAFFPLPWDTVLSLRGELGYMMRNGKDIPIDEKFYLGGINTIRGYESRTICPIEYVLVDGVNTPVYVGGVKEAVFNVDYVFPIIKAAGLKGVLFFDAGNSYGAGEQFFSKMLMSYGAGVRWYSPMGPLRLEYGIPLNPRDGIDKKGGRFEFSIGGFF